MLNRVRQYVEQHPVPGALVGAAVILFVIAIVTGNEWFVVATRVGLLGAGVIATVTAIRRSGDLGSGLPPQEAIAARLSASDEEALAIKKAADAEARRYVIFMALVLLVAVALPASIYDNFKLLRWIF